MVSVRARETVTKDKRRRRLLTTVKKKWNSINKPRDDVRKLTFIFKIVRTQISGHNNMYLLNT